ncbi:recombinase family protein [Anaerocolumna sp. AGMB13020]|uniref:recombinase family protein n=1 Tax=Anaerocolumna sp. AGMB13020 TaxID=3081750 RepID=UPI002954484E|nr:recombinase family protein [Anaerocolumna sp. AGMB13020]WOO38912.1 recombinase family protein [Anaerocolumna sp. AGMB13020]
MRAAAYCRVSTKREEQLDSLESQQKFFQDYAERNGYELVNIYADEGKSGTKMKNRTQLLRLLADASLNAFDLVLIKDISRLARNTVDFLTSIRRLKSKGIKVIFVNYDQTSSESSEFMLTMLSAIAQEESANTSKRVRFGKQQNARLGRVPNLIYGYDKIPGDYFELKINHREAEVVRRIFMLYTQEKKGAGKIADILNGEDIKTKRGCSWSQIGICRLLGNEIYTGKIINGKEEIEDFLTGKRKVLDKEQWQITSKPEFRIVEDEVFLRAQEIKNKRNTDKKLNKSRESNKHPFSQLIKCNHCGGYFRRLTRNYKTSVITWVCSTRNKNGTQSCCNNVTIQEEELLEALINGLTDIIRQSPNALRTLSDCCYSVSDSSDYYNKEKIESEINKKEKQRQKYIELYTKEIISMEELQERTYNLADEIQKLKKQLQETEEKDYPSPPPKCNPEFYVKEVFSDNVNLRRILDRLEADDEGNVDIYLKKKFF